MPTPPPAVPEPWLCGLVACPAAADAAAVLAALKARGLSTRSVPAGRAISAWTSATPLGTLGVVVSGRGEKAARRAASFWMPRARTVVVAASTPAADKERAGRVALDGDHELAVRARSGAVSAAQEGRIAAVTIPVEGPEARRSLADRGYWGALAEIGAWREAASAIGGVVLVCAGLYPADRQPVRLQRLTPPGRPRRSWWRTALVVARRPRQRAAIQALDTAIREAAAPTGACAVAAILGPA